MKGTGRTRRVASEPAPAKRARKSEARTAPGLDLLLVRLGARCRELRAARELTQQTASTRAGIAITHLQMVEGGRTNPSVATLSAIARVFEVTLAELFQGV